MRKTAKFFLVLTVALLLMLCFRALAFTVCTIEGQGLEPLLQQGDRVLVNRWSYGLRVGSSGGLFSYGRLGRRPVKRGDLVAFENPHDKEQILICRCSGIPGDSVNHDGLTLKLPSLADCADADYYWMEALSPKNPLDSRQLGIISEELIIGRVVMVVYSHNPKASPFFGWRHNRTLLPL